MATTTQLSKWGNSLGLRLPKSVAREVQLDEGDIAVQTARALGQLAAAAINTAELYEMQRRMRQAAERASALRLDSRLHSRSPARPAADAIGRQVHGGAAG